jgi:hypothetical protein
MLITEIGGWVDRLNAHGGVVFAVRTPTTYPSDAQLLPDGNILVAGFNTPGRVDEITSRGRIVWTYGPSSGPGALDRPSLAVRWPNGTIAITDDWHHRIVAIDPRTKQIVWQYGHYGIASAAPGFLSKPDGLDLLPATRAAAKTHSSRLVVRKIGALPEPASRVAAAALSDGRVVIAGGLVGGTSSREVLIGAPEHLRGIAPLPTATHDAALAATGNSAYLLGGGEATSTDAVIRIDLRTHATRRIGSLGEPLSDLGATTLGGAVYVVGGWTGTQYATAVLRFRPKQPPALVARLPVGLRYAGVTALHGRIYVAGGVSRSGESRSVFAVDPLRHRVRVVAILPRAVAHAPLAALGRALILVGGTDASGNSLDTVLRIDPQSGAVSVAAHLTTPLADAAAVTARNRVIVIGGTTPSPSDALTSISECC